jgi:N-dimethylarginine dimethylaminohydrolase
MSSSPLLLVVDPIHFEVSYAINPWMQPGAWAEDPSRHRDEARKSFDAFKSALSNTGAQIDVMPGIAGLPDMVFPANAAVILDRRAMVARFRYPERRGEEQPFLDYFLGLKARGILDVVTQFSPKCFQEGAGDCIWDIVRGRFWAGFGQRSTREAADEASDFFGQSVTTLELISPRFYHLDVCFCPLSGGEVLYYPPAFSPEALAQIHDLVSPDKRIEASDEDAARFTVNAVNIGKEIVMASAAPRLVARLAEHGYNVRQVDLSPFIMAGGGAYCMSLRLDRMSETAALPISALP